MKTVDHKASFYGNEPGSKDSQGNICMVIMDNMESKFSQRPLLSVL